MKGDFIMSEEKRLLEMDIQVADYANRRAKGKLTNEEKVTEAELKNDAKIVSSRFRQFVGENGLCTN